MVTAPIIGKINEPINPAIEATHMTSKGIKGLFAMISPSPTSAAIIFGWANLGLIISLAVGVISTILLVWMGNIKEDDLKERLASSNVKAEDAVRGAARANERAKNLAKETEALRNENLKLQVALAPRTLSASQIRALKSLRGKVAAVNICSETDGDSGWLASQIAVALQSVGIKVLGYERSPSAHSTGNMLYDPLAFENPHGKPTGGEPLLEALKRAGLFAGGMSVLARLPMDVSADPAIPMILVGGKPWIAPVSPYVSPDSVK